MEAAALHTISRDSGERVPLGGLDIIFKITSDQTGGALAICETAVEPGRLIPAHLHDTEDEFSYVVEGRIGVLIGDEELTAEAGSWVLKPRGIPHTFWNPGPHHARTIEVITPAGFENFFRELSGIFSADSPPDVERLTTTAARYHHHFRPDLDQPLMEGTTSASLVPSQPAAAQVRPSSSRPPALGVRPPHCSVDCTSDLPAMKSPRILNRGCRHTLLRVRYRRGGLDGALPGRRGWARWGVVVGFSLAAVAALSALLAAVRADVSAAGNPWLNQPLPELVPPVVFLVVSIAAVVLLLLPATAGDFWTSGQPPLRDTDWRQENGGP